MKKIIVFCATMSLANLALAGLPFIGKRDIEIPTGGSHPPVYRIVIRADGNTKVTSINNCDMTEGGTGCVDIKVYDGKFKNLITFKEQGNLYRLTFNKNKTVIYSEYDKSIKGFSAENCPDGKCIVSYQSTNR